MKKLSLIMIIIVLATSLIGCNPKGDITKEVDNRPIDVKVEELISNMTIEQKAGQMIQAERNNINGDEISRYGIGSILSGGGSSPSFNTVDGWQDMYNDYQRAAMESELKIPLLYGVDAVHGHNNVYGATIFPHNIGLGAAKDEQLMFEIGKVVAKEVSITGLNWNFSPTVAVAQDIRWGRFYESFGESPELQNLLTRRYVEGLQQYNIVATAKHFIADGGTIFNGDAEGYKIDQGDAILSEEDLINIHLPGYIEAIEAGVDSVMISFSSYNGEKMHGNKELITDLLKGELGFEGIVISDWEAVHQLPGGFYEQVVSSVNAGVDMLMEPYKWREARSMIINGYNNNDISEERINDAVRRILTVKFEKGLFDNPYVEDMGKEFYSEEHREVAREAVRKSLVLLKNNDVLPLDKNSNILLVGPGSDNIGIQSGGWTIEWQGNNKRRLTSGVSILDGFKSVLENNGGEVYTSYDDVDKADYIVLVLAEKPYAEGVGDNGELTLYSHTTMASNKDAIDFAKSSGLPVVTILISGRPLLVTDEINGWDAFIAAWLPGSEAGSGISDVIFGDYDFTGTLPVSWPKNSSQFGVTVNSDDYNPDEMLFPYNYGLSYNKDN